MLKLTFIFTLLLSVSLYSQNNIDPQKKIIYDSLEKRSLTNAAVIFDNGKEMLNYAQTDDEFARAYHVMGDGKYKDGDFLAAIKFLEKADQYVKSTDIKIAINSLLVYSYRYAGLPTESDNVLEKIKKIADLKDDGESAQVLQVTALSLEIDKNYCDAIPYREKELNLYQNRFKFASELQKKQILTFANVHMAFLQIKCGNHDQALENLELSESIYEDLDNKKPTYFVENYYLVKALISQSENKNLSAKDWFKKSYESAKLTENKATVKKILIEMQNSGLFESPTEKNEIYEDLIHIQNFQTEVTKKTTENAIIKKNQKLNQEKNKRIIYISISTILILGLIALIVFYRLRNKKIYANYQKIITEIELKQAQRVSTPKEIKPEKKEELIVVNDEILEQENSIVKQLETLESKNFFTTQNISATQLAAKLKITPRNLSYILKKYRNEDFYNYLNNLRIDYFTQLLKENPKYRNYKIAALSEMLGYSSHSQFTINFKSKTGITPSQYIGFLQKEQNKI